MIRSVKRCRRKGLRCGEGWVKVSPNSLSRRKIVHSLGSFVLSQHSTRRGPPGETIYHAVVSCPRRVTLKRSIRGISGIVSILAGFAIVSILPLAHADVSCGLRRPFAFALGVIATTPSSSTPPFELDVGQNASAAFAAPVELNSTFTAFFRTMTSHNETDLSSTWHRDVLSRENVTVEAGTFSSYKLNQTLGSFPGIPSGLSGGGNETPYFSNNVGFYVKRVAYDNGTPAAEIRLRPYSYGPAPPTVITATQILLLIVLPVAVSGLPAVLLWRRRKARIHGHASPPTPSATAHHE